MTASGSAPSWRRRALAVAGAMVVLNGCWLQPGWGPTRAGHNPSETGLTDANAATLSTSWSVTFGDGRTLDPVISRYGVHAVSGNVLHTLDITDGGEVWSSEIGFEEPFENHEPSVFRGEVLVGNDRTDGSELEGPHFWPAERGDVHGLYWVESTPTGPITLKGDTFSYTEREVGPQGQVSLYLLHFTMTFEGWQALIQEGGPDTPPITSTSMSDLRIALGIGDEVLAFTRRHPATCDFSTTPMRCEPEWREPLGGTVTVPVFSGDGSTLFVGDTSGAVSALDASTGATSWRADVGASVVATPTLGGGLLFATTEAGEIRAYDADGCGAPTCPARWTADIGSPVREQAALAGGVLYVGSDDGRVRAFVASGCGEPTCEPIWQTSTGSAITGAPTVARTVLLVGTADGRLIAYRPS